MAGDDRPNRRAASAAVPEPMRVNAATIARCREALEPTAKARLRAALLPLIRACVGARELGMGYQWGLPSRALGARIGRFVFIGRGSDLSGPVAIGDLTMVSTGVRLVGDDHRFDDSAVPMRLAFARSPRPVTVIEADCWIGHGAILREGITLARGTVVAAGAVVTRSTTPYSVVAGVPARVLRERFGPEAQADHDRLLYQ